MALTKETLTVQLLDTQYTFDIYYNEGTDTHYFWVTVNGVKVPMATFYEINAIGEPDAYTFITVAGNEMRVYSDATVVGGELV